jgi:anaerobic selenocysteine-containing dehydrogenase
VASALHNYQPDELVFILGLFPDHLNDLVQLLAQALGGARVLRFDSQAEFEGRVTLMDATQRLFGVSRIPYFDHRQAGVIFSFGSSFQETGGFQESWLSSSAAPVRYGRSPREVVHRDSYLVQFDSYPSDTAVWADEWIQVQPGSQAVLAHALLALVAGLRDRGLPCDPVTVDLDLAAMATGVSVATLEYLARLFYRAERKLALPGSAALAGGDGPDAAESILALNILVENLGQPGGLFLAADSPLYPWLTSRPSTIAEVQALVERMQSGQVKALFVHGVDLVAALPASFGVRQALERVEQVFSFACLPDQTSRLADYVLPDHLALESWGYQRSSPCVDRPAVSALQPAVWPAQNTRASADVLLAAFQLAGGSSEAIPFKDELDFLGQSVFRLAPQGGLYRASDAAVFWQFWQTHGGWWQMRSSLIPPVQIRSLERLHGVRIAAHTSGASEYPFHLLLNPKIILEELNRALQVEIHPDTVQALGLQKGRLVKLVSPAGQILVTISLNSQLASDVLAIHWSMGNPVLEYGGREATGNPLDLLGTEQNSSGNLALTGLQVNIEAV